MKFETIGNNKKKVKITLGIVCVIAIIGITAFTLTRASYKQTQSVPLIKGNISYNKSDLEIIAVKIKQDNGTYENSDDIPGIGYTLNESETICKVKNETTSVRFKNISGITYLSPTKKGTKCTLVFDINLAGKILKANGGIEAIKAKGNPDFSKVSCIGSNLCETGPGEWSECACPESTTGMWAMEDDYGTSYYFRGSPTDNYIKFGTHTLMTEGTEAAKTGKDIYWRIIRINGDGTIRMIYDGSEYHPNGTSTSDSIIDNLSFNSGNNDNAYVGYMYKLNNRRGLEISSNVKTKLETWFVLHNFEMSSIVADSGFCGDRTSTTTSGGIPNNTGGTGTKGTYYGSYYRLVNNNIPTLKCATISYGNNSSYEKGTKLDFYTMSSNIGNLQLTHPIGLITADEMVLAGISGSYTANINYYLYNGQQYLTMSPYRQVVNSTSIFVNDFDGGLAGINTDRASGVRPVINIDPTKINNVTIDSNGVYVIS